MKRFLEWMGIKEKIHNEENQPSFNEGEIWWVYLGENVGYEEDGKGEFFLRPFIIIKKFNRELVLGVPCSSIKKENKYYYEVTIKSCDFKTFALLSQIKALSSRRLTKFIGQMGSGQFIKLKTALIEAVFK